MKVIKHPVIEHQLTLMRSKESNSQLFRNCLKTLSSFMAFEVTKNLKTKEIALVTPICATRGKKIDGNIVLVPILRAGLGMVDSFRDLIPTSRIGHIGLYRDEKTKKPIEYYAKFPSMIKGSTVIVLDPMLATGHSAVEAIKIIKKRKPAKIKFVCVVSCPDGIKYLEKSHPDIETYTASIDQRLNSDKYIVPGLGDAGDRIFGTK